MLLFTVMQAFANSPITAIADTAITGMVKAKIVADPTLSNSQVDVTTNKGVVSLSGTVKTDSEADALVQIAQSISSVKDVNTSKLSVQESKHPMADTIITAKIKGLFIREKLFGDKDIAAMSIHVETNNGIVALTGTADSNQQASNAVKIAKSVKGVKNVESRIKVME